MAKPRKRKKSKARKKTKQAILRKVILWGSVGFAFLLATWVGYLDYTVKKQFEGKRWSLPAQVYAAPVELYAGSKYSRNEMGELLERLRYRKRSQLSQPSSYVVRGNRIDIYLREFQFWDELRPAKKLRLLFSAGELVSISSIDTGRSVAIARLDPQLIGNFYPKHKEDRVLVKLDQAPDALIQALLQTEDRDFYNHFGISLKGIARAAWANIRAGKVVQGGSTLTQQLVKNFYLTSKRSFWRKLNEAIMAILLELHFDKDEILEAYLNEIYLAQDGRRAIHGFGLASRHFFGQKLEQLQPHQSALLVALVRGPSYYNPLKHPERAKSRRDRILGQLEENNLISGSQNRNAISKPLDVTGNAKQPDRLFPAFMDLVRRQLLQEYRDEDLTSEGLRIFTTLDPSLQRSVEQTVSRQLPRFEKLHGFKEGALQSAVIVTRREGGEIVAMVGGSRVKYAGFNRAMDAVRPIGSLIKPVVYLTALSKGSYTAASMIDDGPVSVKNHDGSIWAPQNYDKKSHGIVPLHEALAHSYNLATVRVGLEVGVDDVLHTLKKMGVRRPLKAFPSALLGASSLSPLEVAQLYQSFAGDCFLTPLRAIQAVVSSEGDPLNRYPLTVQQAADPAACYIVNTILQEAVREGTGRSAYFYLPEQLNLVGKTGTTNDLRDSWFAGYTGDYLSVVWLGRDDNKPARMTGATGALQVWSRIMAQFADEPVGLIPPDDVHDVWTDRSSGLLADENCPDSILLPFSRGSEPKQSSDCLTPGNRLRNWFGRVMDENNGQ